MNKDNRIKIAYLGGGSYNFGWRFISELSAEEICAEVRLYDTEKQLSLANEVIGNNMRQQPDCKADVVYLASDTPDEALRGADIVIVSFTQGNLDERTAELTVPEQYGIYQSSGEQSGPSGIIKAVKTLPVCAEYAEKIKTLCPKAWVINLTNPMAECIQIMQNVFPEIKIFGSTNELFPAIELIAGMIELEYGLKNIRRRDIKFNLLGICGFCWFDDITYNGCDVMPLFRKNAESLCYDGLETNEGDGFTSLNKVKFDLFLRYGLIPAVSDRIAADFCPAWYLRTPETAESWHIQRVSPSALRKLALERISKIKSLMNGVEFLRVGGHTSDLILQIRALLGGGNLITNVCALNNGQIKNLPACAVVETNALISRNSVKPVASGTLPDDIYGLTVRHCVNHQTVVRSVIEKDLDIAFNAFLNDPLMTTDLNSATELYKQLLAAVRTNLVYYC